MADLSFTKMHGTGNDFIIIDSRNQRLSDDTIIALAPELCHRRFGIGADGIIALQPAEDSTLDYTMFYRNPDGSDAGMCGNGARCLALFAAVGGLGTQLSFNVHDTIYQASVVADKNYVTLSFPIRAEVKKVILDDTPVYQLHAGTEHIVKEVSHQVFAQDRKLKREGKRLRYHSRFEPPGTNVNFIHGSSPRDIHIKTYERGVENLTLACGTGAIASAITWHYLNRNNTNGAETITVHAEGGTLTVRFSFDSTEVIYADIQLSGNAYFVYEGIYTI